MTTYRRSSAFKSDPAVVALTLTGCESRYPQNTFRTWVNPAKSSNAAITKPIVETKTIAAWTRKGVFLIASSRVPKTKTRGRSISRSAYPSGFPVFSGFASPSAPPSESSWRISSTGPCGCCLAGVGECLRIPRSVFTGSEGLWPKRLPCASPPHLYLRFYAGRQPLWTSEAGDCDVGHSISW